MVHPIRQIQMRYFIVTYIKKADGRMDEQIEVSAKLTNRYIRSANVILDFKTQSVEKARLEQPIERNWFVIKGYYQQIYGDIITTLERENSPEPDASK